MADSWQPEVLRYKALSNSCASVTYSFLEETATFWGYERRHIHMDGQHLPGMAERTTASFT